MIYFIRCFFMEWHNFPDFRWFSEFYKHNWKDSFKNRFDFAWKNAKVHYRHRHDYDYD